VQIARICTVVGLPELDWAADHIGGDARGLLVELWLPSVVPKRR
jgi:hypothetical protein